MTAKLLYDNRGASISEVEREPVQNYTCDVNAVLKTVYYDFVIQCIKHSQHKLNHMDVSKYSLNDLA